MSAIPTGNPRLSPARRNFISRLHFPKEGSQVECLSEQLEYLTPVWTPDIGCLGSLFLSLSLGEL